MTVSTDGGRSFAPIADPPGHLIATLPYRYLDDSVPSGIRQPSNVIEGPDGFHYLFGNVSDQPDERQWVCAMRTDDLADPGAWRYWDGSGFTGDWLDPYVDAVDGTEKCAPLADDALAGSVQESVVYDTRLERYVIVGISADVATYSSAWGVYYSTSENLIDWTTRRLLLELPSGGGVADPDNELVHAYPSLIDPDSASLSFETSDGDLYLYVSRFNGGGNSLDRDLVRWPISVEEYVAEPAEWSFDTAEQLDDWPSVFGLDPPQLVDGALVTRSLDTDPQIVSPSLDVDAAFDAIRLRMRVSEGADDLAELFWITDTESEWGESKYLTFDVVGDGVFVEYTIPVGDEPGWTGTITALRIDPVQTAGREIAIDEVAIVHGD